MSVRHVCPFIAILSLLISPAHTSNRAARATRLTVCSILCLHTLWNQLFLSYTHSTEYDTAYHENINAFLKHINKSIDYTKSPSNSPIHQVPFVDHFEPPGDLVAPPIAIGEPGAGGEAVPFGLSILLLCVFRLLVLVFPLSRMPVV